MNLGESAFFDTLAIFVIAAALVTLLTCRLRLPSLNSFIAARLFMGPVLRIAGPSITFPEAVS